MNLSLILQDLRHCAPEGSEVVRSGLRWSEVVRGGQVWSGVVEGGLGWRAINLLLVKLVIKIGGSR